MINKVILVGNLGKDPEIRTLESGTKVATFSIATNENYRDKDGNWQTMTEWHNIVAWRYLAEKAERALKKGSLVYIEGKLTTRKYQDAEGRDRYITEVVARVLQPLEKRGDAYESPPPPAEEPADVAAKSPKVTSGTPATPNNEEDDDLPF